MSESWDVGSGSGSTGGGWDASSSSTTTPRGVQAAAGAGGGQRGPSFQPYWAGLRATYPPAAPAAAVPAPGARGRGRWWWAVVAVTLLVLAGALTDAVPLVKGNRYTIRMAELGTLST